MLVMDMHLLSYSVSRTYAFIVIFGILDIIIYCHIWCYYRNCQIYFMYLLFQGCVEFIVFFSPSGVKYAFHLLQQLRFLISDVKVIRFFQLSATKSEPFVPIRGHPFMTSTRRGLGGSGSGGRMWTGGGGVQPHV